MNITLHRLNQQRGVVSLFTVLFTTLLLTVITVSFLRLMVQEQKQAQNQDMSQSAYDSAISGVEDAKRVLRACYQQGSSSQACKAIHDKTCDTVSAAGVAGLAGAETIIKGDGDDTRMNQAYTCVKVNRDTFDYVGNIENAGGSAIVPLRATAQFNRIIVEWMHRGEGHSGGSSATITPPLAVDDRKSLPPEAEWSDSAPALLRSLLVLPPNASQVSAGELDTDVASTVFLRPWLPNVEPFAGTVVNLSTVRRTAAGGIGQASMKEIACSKAKYEIDMTYSCKAVIIMPNEKYVPRGSRVAFMRMTSLYNATSYRITLFDNQTPVLFDGVQPEVDSTGRAGDILRRVVSKVSGEFDSPYDVEATINTTFDLCKDFYITDEAKDAGGGVCS